jgi:hypothetical protein
MLEIAAHHAGEDLPGAAEHLASCARCRALLASLPDLQQPAPQRGQELPRVRPRPSELTPEDLKTGQLWTAALEGRPDWREIVVVLAPQPAVDDQELVLIAPVDTEFDDATSSDLIVDDSPLGYRHVVSVGMQGVVLRAQLDRFLGRLEMPEREAIVDIYRALMNQTEVTTRAPTGAPLAGPEDPRASARAARSDELRSLFAMRIDCSGRSPRMTSPR